MRYGENNMIEVKDLKRYYESGEEIIKALDGVSFAIEKGEFVAVMGASGSGKTTLLRILSLIDSYSEGEYFIDSLNTAGLSDAEKTYYRLTQLGYVFQDYALINEMTALENVYILSLMEGKSKKESIKISLEALEKVGLGTKATRLPNQLSGGEKQRVSIARAIAKNPNVLFADEPCANLDTKISADVLNLFRELNNKYKQTIVMVTHEPWHVEYVSRVVKLKDGVIISDKKAAR
jgi:putative ABC transport system ATP-binding protein